MNTYYQLFIKEENKLPYYVKLIGGHANQRHIMRHNGYPDHQWIHCLNGKGKLIIEGKEFIICKNSGFYLSPSIPHEYYALEEPWETNWISFSGSGIQSFLDCLGIAGYETFYFNDIKYLDYLLLEIFNIAKVNSLTSGLKCSGKLYNFLIEVNNAKIENSGNLENSLWNKLQPILNYVELSYNKNPSIDEMAALIGISPQYLCRLFRQTLNIRPFTYITKYRLQKAKELLIDDLTLKIHDISESIGYNDESYFCALFKKYEGVTPTEYRKINQCINMPKTDCFVQ
jgi:AraC family transcriptional regulator, arabinose operon regulatory protein